ncbi:AAA family ATPase [Saccharothrix sp. NRRL B-16348]|uniref:AAA family ATPase n=1 Tax=Saccharothrix sp. NRRL B-16348 TaxID=1415542 RepID=UPI0006AD9EBB|nr:AAA family ATPase [Saccharothrix sp. NRRL B-16348]
MHWSLQLGISITSGLTVALVLAVVRALRARRRVPEASAQKVNRRNYLSRVLRASRDKGVRRLHAVVPNLTPAAGNEQLVRIQEAWEKLNTRGEVRVVTRESHEGIVAAAELAARGIEVRVDRSHNANDLSFHVFGGERDSVVINHRARRGDRPFLLNGPEPAQVFQNSFDQSWDVAVPLESVLAEEALRPGDTVQQACARSHGVRAKYQLDDTVTASLVRHVAFRHSAAVVFIVGQPGAGKSTVRRHLAAKLRALRFQVVELTDYPFAFHDHVHRQIALEGARGEGFTAHAGGAFHVRDERDLEPALRSLSNKVWENRGHTRITLVEFARSDLAAAFQVFGDEVLAAAQVIHVTASAETRAARLAQRAQPPKLAIVGHTIVISPSDDHQLPSPAAKALYASDHGHQQLGRITTLKGRVHRIDNDQDDVELDRADAELDAFVNAVVRPYKASRTVAA